MAISFLLQAQLYAPPIMDRRDYRQASDEELCQFARGHSRDIPQKLFDNTYITRSVVSCARRDLTIERTTSSNASSLRGGWLVDRLEIWHRTACRDDAPYRSMVERGWRITLRWSLLEGVTEARMVSC